MELLRNHFEVLSIDRQASERPRCGSTSDVMPVPDEGVHVRLRSLPGDHTHRNADQLFDDVVRTWCEAGPSLWLERDGEAKPRNAVLHILPIQLIAGGDFKNRGTFSELWQHQCNAYGGAEIIFLHDLRLVTIVFRNSDGTLFKIEFRYDQLREFVTLSFPQEETESADIFFCLRHVPLLGAEKSRVSPLSEEADDCSFSEYYLHGYSDDENGEAEDGNLVERGNEVEEPGESSGGESDNEDVLLWQPNEDIYGKPII